MSPETAKRMAQALGLEARLETGEGGARLDLLHPYYGVSPLSLYFLQDPHGRWELLDPTPLPEPDFGVETYLRWATDPPIGVEYVPLGASKRRGGRVFVHVGRAVYPLDNPTGRRLVLLLWERLGEADRRALAHAYEEGVKE